MGLWNELAPKLLPIFHDVGAIITNVVVPAFRDHLGLHPELCGSGL
jgi:hypothetical protein